MKVLIHAHTTYSSYGRLSPPELAQVARRFGYDAVLVADDFEHEHEERLARLVAECRSISQCLMVPGCERTVRGYDLLSLGIDRWVDDPDVRIWCNKVRSAGGITAIAHPVRYDHMVPADLIEAVDAIEVWNSRLIYEGNCGPNPLSYGLLGDGRYPLCSQDLLGGWPSAVGIQIDRKCASAADILSCLRRGDYRMTNGVMTFGPELSEPTKKVLNTFHRARRQALNFAKRLRAL